MVLNPSTPVSLLEPVFADVGLVLVMSVNPGFGGQAFIESAIEKLAAARAARAARSCSFLLEVDGGIRVENARRVAAAGAEVLVSGSGVFGTPDYAVTIAAMRRGLDAGLGT